MSAEGYWTLSLVLGMLVLLARNFIAPDLGFVLVLAILTASQIITPTEAFAGFANQGMITVAALFVVTAGLRDTGLLEWVGRSLLGSIRTERGVLLRLTAIIVPLSAFLNNTPIVAMFLPVMLDWCRRTQISPSRVLIPLSFLTILGGTCTLIGTSTNLVVHGLMLDAGLPGLGFFELAAAGVPYALIGAGYLYIAGPSLLPKRKELLEELSEQRREYLVEMVVQPGCPLAGKTVEAAGLRNLTGLFLIEIDRNGSVQTPVRPDDEIQVGDHLVFTGIVSHIVDLQRMPGLVPASEAVSTTTDRDSSRRLCEAVISGSSPLVGKTLRDADFRAVYSAAVVAVHRGGRRLLEKIGQIKLEPGDTLLLQTGSHFLRAHRNDPAFYLVTGVDEWRPVRNERAWIAGLLFLTLIGLFTFTTLSTALVAVLIACLMVVTGCLSAGDARNSIDWQTIITIAAAFGVGTALENSGAARVIAEQLVQWTLPFGPIAALAAIYIIGSTVTEVITNNAAAVLIFPFCLETAKIYDVDSRPFLIALVLSASASFMSPIGYQTNMMVYGPGNYRFSDFMRIGGPLNTLLTVVAIVLIPMIWAW